MVVSKSTPQWVAILKHIRLPMVGRSRKAVLGGGVVASSVFQYGLCGIGLMVKQNLAKV